MADTSASAAGLPSEVTATAMRILRLLATNGTPATAGLVARRLDLDEPEAKRLLNRLTEYGFAARTGETYLLGDRVLRLARRLAEEPPETR